MIFTMLDRTDDSFVSEAEYDNKCVLFVGWTLGYLLQRFNYAPIYRDDLANKIADLTDE
jgi:hypothetical protein